MEYGFSYPCFGNPHECCYAGEDPEFMEKYCMNDMSILDPIDIEKVLEKNDK